MGEVLFHNCRYLITGTHGNDDILEGYDLLVEDTQIKTLGPSTDVEVHNPHEADIEIVDCSQKIVLPGLHIRCDCCGPDNGGPERQTHLARQHKLQFGFSRLFGLARVQNSG